MGLYDRPYWREGQGQFDAGQRPPTRTGLPRPGRALMVLLAANVAVFILQIVTGDLRPGGGVIMKYFTVVPAYWWQIWRFLTFQFLHGGVGHLLFNMLGLYFLGQYLQRDWGSRRFVVFYLLCGVAAGIAHVVLSLTLSQDQHVPLLGASGGVYGVVVACAILYPHIKLIIFPFPFLISIRVAAAIFLGISLLGVLMDVSAAVHGSEFSYSSVAHMAHLGGAVAAVAWLYLMPKLRGAGAGVRGRIKKDAWRRKMEIMSEQQAEIDRILDKIRRDGIASLTDRERRTLQQATEDQREEERNIYRS